MFEVYSEEKVLVHILTALEAAARQYGKNFVVMLPTVKKTLKQHHVLGRAPSLEGVLRVVECLEGEAGEEVLWKGCDPSISETVKTATVIDMSEPKKPITNSKVIQQVR